MKKMLLLFWCATLTLHAADQIGPVAADEAARHLDRVYLVYSGRTRPVDTPPPDREKFIREGDEIVNGYIRVFDKPTEIGISKLDWSMSKWKSVEHVARLNRMWWLDTLCGAWQLTGDAKYSIRARTLLDDWMNWMDARPGTFDPDSYNRNNVLNVSDRVYQLINVAARLRHAPGFDDAFMQRLLATIVSQTDFLCANTRISESNWSILQASSLLHAGLAFDFLPGAEKWRKHAIEVLDGCFAMIFLPDGVHCECTPGYHYGVVWSLSNTLNLAREFKLSFRHLNREAFAQIMNFSVLAQPFAFNDTGYNQFNPAPNDRYDEANTAVVNWTRQKLGLADWVKPAHGIFPAAGFVFGGNGRERLFFDAGRYGGWHSHYGRLSICYNRDGFLMLADPGTSSYNWQDERMLATFIAGRETAVHPTLTFDRACQLPRRAELLDAAVNDHFMWGLGDYSGGYFSGKWKNGVPEQISIDAEHRRAVLWLADDYLLIFDRTRILSSVNGNQTRVNIEFPLVPQEAYQSEKTRFFTTNRNRPNLTLQLLSSSGFPVTLLCEEGIKSPNMRGWIAFRYEDMTPAPLVEFSAATEMKDATFITLLASAPVGREAPQFKVLSESPGAIDLQRPDGGMDAIRYVPDFRLPQELTANGTTRRAAIMLVRHSADGKSSKIFVVRMPRLSDKSRAGILYTGWL